MIRISKHTSGCNGTVRLPASKSISNRLLILQYAYGQSLSVSNLSNAEDTVLMSTLLDLLRQYQKRGDNSLLRLDAQNAGSVMRFLVPLLSVTRGHFLLTGNERMMQRPIGALVEAMRETGAEIDFLGQIGFPPLIIRGRPVSVGRIRIDASVSSQFVTALLLLAPTLENGLTLELTGVKSSWPYVRMTTALLDYLNIHVVVQEDAIRVFPKKVLDVNIEVECDWSAASFFYCMLSMAKKGEIFFPGLKKSGLQGDQQVAVFFDKLGIITTEEDNGIRIKRSGQVMDNFYADFTDFPDLALPVILACGSAGINGTFTGLDRLRIKESDRISALSAGLLNAGLILTEEFAGSWRLSGRMADPANIFPDDFEDHRVAMTLSLLAMKGFTVHLEHPEAVNKSYPGYWKALESLGFNCDFSC